MRDAIKSSRQVQQYRHTVLPPIKSLQAAVREPHNSILRTFAHPKPKLMWRKYIIELKVVDYLIIDCSLVQFGKKTGKMLTGWKLAASSAEPLFRTGIT